MQSEKWYYPASDINPSLTDTSVSFDPQLPLGVGAGTALRAPDGVLMPPGIMMLDGGGMRLNFFAGEEATRVSARIYDREYELRKGDNGLFSAEVHAGVDGFCPVMFFVDGAEVLNPLAPIGFGGSRPINYADIPQEHGAFFALTDVPHGAVTQDYYYAPSTGTWKSCLVYTPPGYMKDDSATYPVLYLQHGHGENEQCWVHQGRANFILDNLLAQKKIEPFVVVMNNGMVQVDESGLRKLDVARIESLLIQDCIPYIEKTYRVKPGKWNRAMAGLSMGSMQTSMVTLNHPELFGYAGIFSGFVRPLPLLVRDDGYIKALDDPGAFKENYRVFFRACGDQDFLALKHFGDDGALFQQKRLSPSDCPAHEEVIYHGGHEWNVWRMCLRDFAQRIFCDRTQGVDCGRGE